MKRDQLGPAALVAVFSLWLGLGLGIHEERRAQRQREFDSAKAAALRDAEKRAQAWQRYMANRPADRPLTITFPNLIADPVMWDFTQHAILNHQRRVWTWEMPAPSGAITIETSSASASYVVNNVIWTGNSAGEVYLPPSGQCGRFGGQP